MRLLFAFAGGRGHAEPLVPIASAAETAGHEIAFAGRRAVVVGLGFRAFAVGPDVVPERSPLVAFDVEREERVVREGFAGRLARAQAEDVLALCGSFATDAVVCDEFDFGSMVAAERLGLPCAPVLVSATGAFLRRALVAEPLAQLRMSHGLPAEPPAPKLTIAPIPPSLRDPGGAVCIRPCAPALMRPDDPPLVYFTLGTVFPLESGDLFARVLSGLGELPIEALVTTGRWIDPGELGPLPANVRAERFVPQSAILPRCSAVVCHGGSGTVTGALAHGLPLVTIPIGADQPLNAARCEALGVGPALDALRATPAGVRDAVAAVLGDPAYRAAAERVRDEIAALPGPDHALALLERLVLR